MKRILLLLLALLTTPVAHADAPLQFGPSGPQLIQAGNLTAKDGSIYPKSALGKNYLSNAVALSAWAVSGAGLNASLDTTAADLPRATTTGRGIKFTGVSGSSAFAYTDFTLDPADYGVKEQVQFAMACGLAGGATSSCAASDFRLDVYSCTVAWSSGTCSGTMTRLPLTPTDSSSVTALPLLTGTYSTTFDAPGSAAPYLQLQVGLNQAQTHSLVMSDLIVGPGTVVQSAAVSGWDGSSTSTAVYSQGTAASLGTGSIQYKWKRDGSDMLLEGVFSSTGGTTGSGEYTLRIPTGYNIDYTAYVSGQNAAVGTAVWVSGFSGGGTAFIVNAGAGYTDYIRFTFGTLGWNATNYPMATNGSFTFHVRVPIAEWAGSGTVAIAPNQGTFYYCTGTTWGTSSTCTTAQGPGGAQGGSTTPAATFFQYTFTPTYPIPSGVIPILEVSPDQIHWTGLGNSFSGFSGTIEHLRNDGTNYIGASASITTSGGINVTFGKYPYGLSSAWNGTWYWRVEVPLPNQATGFAGASAQAQGLVSYEQWLPNQTATVTANSGGGSLSGANSMTYDANRVGHAFTINGDFDVGTVTGTVTSAKATVQFTANKDCVGASVSSGVTYELAIAAGTSTFVVNPASGNFASNNSTAFSLTCVGN